MIFHDFKSEYYATKEIYAYAAGDVLYPSIILDHYLEALWVGDTRNRYCKTHAEIDRVCRCGIWGYKTTEDLARTERGLMVVMVLLLSGRILEYEKGYIADQGQITKIYIASPRFMMRHSELTIDRLRDRYGVEVVLDMNFWGRHKPQRELTEDELFEEWKREREAEQAKTGD